MARKKTVCLIGSGDMGRQLQEFCIDDGHYGSVVFLDDYDEQDFKFGWPIIGRTREIKSLFSRNFFDEVIICFGYKHLEKKLQLQKEIERLEVPFGSMIHSTSWISKSAEISTGVIIYPRSVIDQRVEINSGAFVNLNVIVSHDSHIGKCCFLSPGAVICGFSEIGDCSFIGANSTIRDGIKIHKNTIVGAGAVVTKEIKRPGLYTGIPAKIIQ